MMYLGQTSAAGVVSNAFAYAPGDANMQVWGSQLWLARPFGPRGLVDGVREDLFLDSVRTILDEPGVRKTYFIDNWDTYHRGFGEVHCGTNVIRLSPGTTFDRWWEYEPQP